MNKFSEKGNQAGSPFNAKDQFAKGVIYGDFYTVDKPQPWAKAVAIIGGRFVYVGDVEGVKELIEKHPEQGMGFCFPA